MVSRQFTASPDWVREGEGSGVVSGFQEEMQLTGQVSVGGLNKNLQVIVRSEERNLLDLDESKTYQITIEEVV